MAIPWPATAGRARERHHRHPANVRWTACVQGVEQPGRRATTGVTDSPKARPKARRTRPGRSRASQPERRCGSVDRMISSTWWLPKTSLIAATGSGSPTSPWTSAPTVAAGAARDAAAAARPPYLAPPPSLGPPLSRIPGPQAARVGRPASPARARGSDRVQPPCAREAAQTLITTKGLIGHHQVHESGPPGRQPDSRPAVKPRCGSACSQARPGSTSARLSSGKPSGPREVGCPAPRVRPCGQA